MKDLRARIRMNQLSVLLSSLVLLAASPSTSMEADTGASCAVVDIHEVGWSRLADIKSTEGAAWWIELGGELVFCGSDLAIAKVSANHQLLASHEELDLDVLEVARGFHQSELDRLGLEVIAEAAGVALVRGEDLAIELGQRLLLPAVPDSVEVRQAANKTPRGRVVFAPEVQGLVDMVDGDRWFADVETLASYNRYTHNSGIDDARTWLVAQLQTLPGLQVTTSSFQVGDTTAYNVIATLTGRTRPEEWYIIGAHYDSISQNPQVAAPGAEDNGSGCAGVLEMARIFAANPPDATTLFICYSAEELGLLGSYDHVDDLIAAENLDNVQAMLDLDMIGFTSDADLDCKLETEPFASFLFDVFEDAALQFTTLTLVTDLNACCSDHQPYLEAGVPALLTIEADWFQYPFYHTVNDLPEHLTIDMAREILKMNVAAMAQMIGVPDPPFFCFSFDNLCDGIEITQVLPDKTVDATWRNHDCAGATAPMLGGYSGKNVSPRLSWLAADPSADLSTWSFNLNVDARTFDLWVHDTDFSLIQMLDDEPYSVTPGACLFGPEKERLRASTGVSR